MERQNPQKLLLHYMEAFNSYCGLKEGDVNSLIIPIFQDDADQSAGEVNTLPIVEFPDEENLEEEKTLSHLECSDYVIQTIEEDEENLRDVENNSPELLDKNDFEEVTTIPLPMIPGEEDKFCKMKKRIFSDSEISDDVFQFLEKVKTVHFADSIEEDNTVEMQTISSPKIPGEQKLGEEERISLSEFQDMNLEEVKTIPQPEYPDEENHNFPPFLVQ